MCLRDEIDETLLGFIKSKSNFVILREEENRKDM